MSNVRNPVADKIDRRFRVGGEWLIPKEDAEYARLLHEAMTEIDRLNTQVRVEEEAISAAVKDQEDLLYAQIQSWSDAAEVIHGDAKKLRNAAQSFVTQYDKIEGRSSAS